jgi:hypothetical protein
MSLPAWICFTDNASKIVFVSVALLLDARFSSFELTIKISEMYYTLPVLLVFLPQSF